MELEIAFILAFVAELLIAWGVWAWFEPTTMFDDLGVESSWYYSFVFALCITFPVWNIYCLVTAVMPIEPTETGTK